ncbi:hypothetical protein DVH24_033436 [Malus domestica]|uniref:Phosphoglycerate mutase-like protein 1 n=1 Tax=Malus domestica TaxID=3750 RepID=A0A498JAQ4_MALDO|nr:hypothetical protein DVH24_033436 [Malus domestica]
MTVSISAIYTPLFSQNPLFVPTPISKLPKVISPSPQPPPRSSVGNLHKHVQACGISKKIDLVITSPLLRTMQTAVGVFGGEAYTDGIDVPPLMVANAGNSDHPAISSLNSPPFIAVELCREHLIENEDDILWTPDVRELNEEVAARGLNYFDNCSCIGNVERLWTRKEKDIAIVSHSGFLFHTLSAFGNDCHPSIKSEICTHFANCELRSVVIVDRSLMGSDSSTTNYPGKIPRGPDLPSDVADEKHSEKGASNLKGKKMQT